MTFWDDPDVATASDFFKFENVGDEIAGTIARLGKRVWPDGNVGIELLFAEDGKPALTANQTLLRRALFELKPVPGDHIAIKMIEVEKLAGGKTLKRFHVVLKRADGGIETIDQAKQQPGF